jgi:hypothetical protein
MPRVGGALILGGLDTPYVQAHAAEYGVAHTMWWAVAHHNHVHVTVH